MKIFGRIACALCTLLFLAGCGARVVPIQGHVEDLNRFPQDLFAYIDVNALHTPLISEEMHRKADARSTRLFFHPWHMVKSSVAKKDAYMMLGTDPLTAKPRGTSSNLLPWTEKAWKALVYNGAPRYYPSMTQRAITLRPTSLRGAPTAHPRFGNPEKAGQGYPFDMFQSSAIPLSMPLFITHQSQDGAWYYAETSLASGWIQAYDIAFVDDAFCKDFEARKLVVLAGDSLGLFDEKGRFLTEGHIGTLLPHSSFTGGGHSSIEVLVPVRKADGFAVLLKSYVSVSEAGMKPLPMTPHTLAHLGDTLLDRPYGWGGMYEDRDCSSLLRDMFLACGIWLPRNSAAQAKAWNYVPFIVNDSMDTATEIESRKQQIRQEAKPFLTLFWLQGHIALYIGEYDGEPAMMHSIWGLRTVRTKIEERGRIVETDGRHVIGRVVITGTQPGLELPNRGDNADLLLRMKGMSIF